MERDPDDLAARRLTVLEVRSRKGMVVGGANWVPCAGSFFMSPEVPGETAVAIALRVRGPEFAESFLNWYRPDAATSRVPAALVLRAAGLMNGDRWGGLALSPHHLLALCKVGPATGSEVAMVSRVIQARVQEALGIALQPEVKFLGTLREEPLAAFLARHPLVAGEAEPEWARAFGVPGT
jgi:UDP-N-acetylenolpyruvoylglucosamine reductase